MGKVLLGIICWVVMTGGSRVIADERSDFELSPEIQNLGVTKIAMQFYPGGKWMSGVDDLLANSDGQLQDLQLLIEYYGDHFSGFKNGVEYPREAVVRLLQKDLAASLYFSTTQGGFSLLHMVFSGVDPDALSWILEHQPEVAIGVNGHGILYVLENGKGRSFAEFKRVQKARNRFLELYFLRVQKIPPQDLALALKYVVTDHDLALAQILVDAGVDRATMTPNPEDFYSVDPDTEVGAYLKKHSPEAYALFPERSTPSLDGEACDPLLDPEG